MGATLADVPYDLRLYVKQRELVAEIVLRITKGRFSRAAGLSPHRAPYIVTLIRLALHGSLQRLVRCIVCKKFAVKRRTGHYPFCSKACSRKHDSDTKRPSKLDRALATLPHEFQHLLVGMRGWSGFEHEKKFNLISNMQTRAKTYRVLTPSQVRAGQARQLGRKRDDLVNR